MWLCMGNPNVKDISTKEALEKMLYSAPKSMIVHA